MTELERQLTEALKRLSAQPAGEAYHGRESYKSNWDCTICASYRNAASVPTALEWRGNWVKLRDSHPLFTPFVSQAFGMRLKKLGHWARLVCRGAEH